MLVYILILIEIEKNFGALLCACFNFVTGSKNWAFNFVSFMQQ